MKLSYMVRLAQKSDTEKVHPNWDPRKHKIVDLTNITVYHGTHKDMADLYLSTLGPTHPKLKKFKVKQWIGPLGFYVTAVLDRAKTYAKANALRWGNKNDARVVEWKAHSLGLNKILLVIKEPNEEDIKMAKDLGLSGIRGPGNWGILIFDPNPVKGQLIWSAE